MVLDLEQFHVHLLEEVEMLVKSMSFCQLPDKRMMEILYVL